MENNIEKLRKDLSEGIVELTFLKVNGDLRTIFASMSKDYLPEQKASKPSGRTPPAENVLFWDMDALCFKSCKFDNVISWKPE